LQCFDLSPDLEFIPKSFEEDINTVLDLINVDLGESVFSMLAFGDFSLQLPRHFLHPP
jgi:hypothetical protein